MKATDRLPKVIQLHQAGTNRRCFVLMFAISSILVWQASAQTFKALHTFTAVNGRNGVGKVNSDGANPSGLILSGNMLFGTAASGGSHGKGTVFKLITDGTGFVTLHDFNGNDGSCPVGTLTLADKTLYGTTRSGGVLSTGTVFAVNTDGTGFRTIYNFRGRRDGCVPYGGVIVLDDIVYGSTYWGGNYANNHSIGDVGFGTVFAVNTDGTGFRTLHAFSGTNDGARPICKMVLSGTTMYGTTEQGCEGSGTVFKINVDGTGFTNLHRFMQPHGSWLEWTNVDGIYLESGLLLSGSTLYGAANIGGNWNKGTVFAIKTDGSDFRVMHSFDGADDGGEPLQLIESRGKLYGTAVRDCKGSVFSISTEGTGFTNVFTLSGKDDGLKVRALALSGNILYGISSQGIVGLDETRNGTVFRLVLAP
jgi:uncharacterized repeat protein (TIGR03803 family)